jgi:hypothetical protein
LEHFLVTFPKTYLVTFPKTYLVTFAKHFWSLFQKHIWSLLQNISGHFSKTFLVTFPKTFLVTYPKNLVTLSTSMDDEFKTSGTDPLGWTNSLQSDAGAMSSWGRFDETISDVI